MKFDRLSTLDSLRGIACLEVLMFHFTLGYGDHVGWLNDNPPSLQVRAPQVGLAIFFVISGFVISMTLERSETPMDFAVSRFIRLYPPFWISLLITSSVISFFGFNPFHLTYGGFVASLTMLNGLTNLPFVDPSYWTLTRELLFYMLLCGIYFIAGRERVTISVLIWVLVSATYNLFFADDSYYGVTSLTSCISVLLNSLFCYLFASGIMLFKLHSGERSWLVVITLAISIISASISEWPTHHALVWTTSIKCAAYVTIIWAAVFGYLNLIQNRVLIFFGTISYSLYLIHQVVGFYLINVMQKEGLNVNATLLTAVALTVALAAGICYGVERPTHRMLRRWYRSSREAE